MALSEEFKRAVKEASGIIKEAVEEEKSIFVISHIDADGIASAGIMGRALHALGARYSVRCISYIDKENLKETFGKNADLYVFTDIGGSYIDLIDRESEGKEVVVIDHHQPLRGSQGKNLLHVNPHIFGMDGSIDVSGAGMTYLVAREIVPPHLRGYLVSLAVVGALGDMQDKKNRRLVGLNREFAEEGEKLGYLKREHDLLFYGRETRPIHKAIARTMNPFLPGLTGNEKACLELVQRAGIRVKEGGRWKSLADLSEEEKEMLYNEIASYLLKNVLKAGSDVPSLVGEIYTLVRERAILRDGREFSTLLNACGRSGNVDLGIAIAMGDRGRALEEAGKVLAEYRRQVASAVNAVLKHSEKRIELKEGILFVHGEGIIDEEISGTVSTIISNLYREKVPIVLITNAKNAQKKISVRVPISLVKKGMNAGLMMKEVASSVGGLGGGHDVAAGAVIPIEKEEEFVEKVLQWVKEHVSG